MSIAFLNVDVAYKVRSEHDLLFHCIKSLLDICFPVNLEWDLTGNDCTRPSDSGRVLCRVLITIPPSIRTESKYKSEATFIGRSGSNSSVFYIG